MRVPSFIGFVVSVPLAIGALVVASVIGNRVNRALPRGYGWVGVLLAAALVAVFLVLLTAPSSSWRRVREWAGRRRRSRAE